MASAPHRFTPEELQTVTCRICKSIYDFNDHRPKMVSCLHTLCSSCVKAGAPCGTCGAPCKQDSIYPDNPLILAMLRNSPKDHPTTAQCKAHSKACELYCMTCSELICIDCILSNHKPGQHEYCSLESAVDFVKLEMKTHLTGAKRGVKSSQDNLISVQKLLDNLKIRSESVISQIDDVFESWIKALKVRQDELKEEVLASVEKKCKLLSEQERSFRSFCEIGQNACALGEILINELLPPIEVLNSTALIRQRLEVLDESFEPKHPVCDDHISVVFENLGSQIPTIGKLEEVAASLDHCVAEGPGLNSPSVGSKAIFNIHIRNGAGSQCWCPESSVSAFISQNEPNKWEPLRFTPIGNSTFQVVYYPQIATNHYIKVTYEGKDIAGSPYSVNVLPSVDYNQICRQGILLGDKGNSPGYFDYPSGLSVTHDGNMVIADQNNQRVQILAADGTVISCFGKSGVEAGQFSYPVDTAVTPTGQILVVNQLCQRVDIFSQFGEWLGQLGGVDPKNPTHGKAVLSSPSAVACNYDGDIYILDKEKAMIFAFLIDGTPTCTIGKGPGSKPGYMKDPQGLVIDQEGNIVVSDTGNNRLQVFSSTGKPLRQIGSEGFHPGQFRSPTGITVDCTGFYVIADEGNSRVQILKPDGTAIAIIGQRGPGNKVCSFSAPRGVCWDGNALLFITDIDLDKVHVLRYYPQVDY